MDEIATDERWHFTTEGSKTVTRTTYYFRASTILVAVMAALTAAMLLVAQEPAKAGVPIDDGCLPGLHNPTAGWVVRPYRMRATSTPAHLRAG
jgi:hypothetical protein